MTTRQLITSLTLALAVGASAQEAPLTLMNEVRVAPYPADGSAARRNPPALLWPDRYPHLGAVLDGAAETELKPRVTYRVRLSQDSLFQNDVTEATRSWAFFNPSRRLDAGRWYWQYAFVTPQGSEEWSATYRFDITDAARDFCPPSFDELVAKLPASHPRILTDRNDWDDLRRRTRGRAERKLYTDRARKAMKKPLLPFEEAIDTSCLAGLTNKVQRKSYLIREGRKIFDASEADVEAMTRAYILTADTAYMRGAMRTIKEMLAWSRSPLMAGDFNRSVLLSVCTLAYDSFYDRLTADERALLLSELHDNGSRFYNEYVNHLENRIADNHVWQMTLRILTMAAFATYGELPEAAEWADYCYNMWVARLPGLTADGAWHNGDSYFQVNLRTLIEVPAFYTRVSGFNFFGDPWYEGSIRYAIYHQLPGSMSAGHGNAHENMMKPNGTRTGYVDALARELQCPLGTDYVNRVLAVQPDVMRRSFLGKSGDLTWYRLTTRKELPAVDSTSASGSMTAMPHAKVFPETGVATMHTSPADYRHNASLSFRSSPYGSTSHALANQNAFNTFYGGTPLFYSSGYRTGFSDAHSVYAYRATRAHNSILVDGMGQRIGTEGYGTIPRYYEGGSIAYMVGDASHAYGEVVSPLWLKRAEMSEVSFDEAHGWGPNKLRRFRRHVAQLGDTGLFVVYDDLEATEPVAWSFLLHSNKQMLVEEDDAAAAAPLKVTARNDVGESIAYIFCSDAMAASQTDQYFEPPVNWLNKTDASGKPIDFDKQWHFTATSARCGATRILTIIDTHASGEKTATPTWSTRRAKSGKSDKQTVVCGDWAITYEACGTAKPMLQIVNTKSGAALLYGGEKLKAGGKSYRNSSPDATLIVDPQPDGTIRTETLTDREYEYEI